ncbi:hypothetical protein [Cellulomonas sp. APG4]|uniref:hypothetical protein n=1 Tax=Cellulomonas sp. APG4 TaxID=1538656 RepID=UPI00192A39FD|nr:hypothetical protein [Cellulomonas sp. APG4]
MSVESYPPAAPFLPAEPRENVGRGALVALLTVPAGVAVWVLVWGMGFIASIVGFGVAFLALRLYVWGAGRISRVGALVVLAVTVVTLLLAFFGGIVYDAAHGIGQVSGLGTWAAFTHAEFWPTFSTLLPEALPEYLPDFGLASAFGALGAFTTLRSAFAAAEAATPTAYPAPAAPVAEAPAPAAPVTEPSAPEAQGTPGQA